MQPESPPARMPWGFVAALSLAQLVSWGIVFYAFALFLEPMAQELGWSRPALTLAYSLGLGASALTAYPAGRLIDQGRGRLVMTAGSLISSALLVAWSRVESYPAFVLIWIGISAALAKTDGKSDDPAALIAAMRSVKLDDTPRGPISFDDHNNVVADIYVRRVEKSGGKLVNRTIKTYRAVSQFWTYDPKWFLAQPVYSRDYPPTKS